MLDDAGVVETQPLGLDRDVEALGEIILGGFFGRPAPDPATSLGNGKIIHMWEVHLPSTLVPTAEKTRQRTQSHNYS